MFFHHGGGIDGFITSVVFFPDDDIGLVAFNNIGSGLPAMLTSTAADRVLGLEDGLRLVLERARLLL